MVCLFVNSSVVGFYRIPARRGADGYVSVWVLLPSSVVPVDGGSAYGLCLVKASDVPAGDLLGSDCIIDVDRFGRVGSCKIFSKEVKRDDCDLDASD